jgi:FtsH-binding integral membrane protein
LQRGILVRPEEKPFGLIVFHNFSLVVGACLSVCSLVYSNNDGIAVHFIARANTRLVKTIWNFFGGGGRGIFKRSKFVRNFCLNNSL